MSKRVRWTRVFQKPAAVLAAVGVMSCAAAAQAQLYQAPYGPGGTWNLYEKYDGTATWADALEIAQSSTQQGVSGDLASIHSFNENLTVQSIGGGADVWIGLTDREGAAPQLEQNGAMSPQESIELEGTCCDAANAKLMGWAWTSGEPFTYSNWNGGEPNNWDGVGPAAPDSGYEDAVVIWGDGTWNDAASGYAEDEPAIPVLQPGSSTDESLDTGRAGQLNFVIEYRTAAASPFAGIPIYEVPSLMPAALTAFEPGGAGYMSVTDLDPVGVGVSGAVQTAQQIIDIVNGDLDADVYTKQVAYSDLTDPDTNPNGGPVYVDDVPDTVPIYDDLGSQDTFIEIWRGYLDVETAGDYTFEFHTDDGFVAKIPGADWQNVTGGTSDGELVMFTGDTGDSNTTGVVALTAGVHEFQMYWWENGGGAFAEVTAGLGNGERLPLGLGLQWVAAPTGLRGDFNGDGVLDASDINALTSESAAGSNNVAYDLNGDNAVNDADIKEWIGASDIFNSYVGDANLDKQFDTSDLVVLFAAGTYENGAAAVWTTGDFTGDGLFTTSDLVAALSDGGYENGPKAAVSAVPEPSSLMLLALGALSACGAFRRRK